MSRKKKKNKPSRNKPGKPGNSRGQDHSTNKDKPHSSAIVPHVHTSELDNDVILDVNRVWKIFCRNLKRSMRYGLQDLGRQLIGAGRDRTHENLRPGEFFAVRDANFQVRKKQCMAMIGPNGAGKSTMLKMVNGLIRPDSGEIRIRGKTGALIELGTGFNPLLSGRENIYINGAVLGITKNDIDKVFDEIVDFAELGHVIDDPIKTYSSGMRVRLGFSVSSNLRPELLIIDEVLAVGDVGFRMKCFAHLRRLVDEGVAIILVTHAIAMLARVATDSVVFGKGKIVHFGDLETGTAVYDELMETAQENRDAKLEKLTGKQKQAWIDSVEVLNGSNEPQTEFETGETLQVKIQVASRVPLKRCRLICALLSPVHGSIFSTSSVSQDVHIEVTPEGNEVIVKFDNLPLMIGAFYFNISLFGEDTYDFHERKSAVGMFRVTSPPINANGMGINGMVKLNHTWRNAR